MEKRRSEKRRHTLLGDATLDEKLHWSLEHRLAHEDEDEAFVIELPHYRQYAAEKAQKELALRLLKNRIDWLWRDGKLWFLDVEKMRRRVPNVTDLPWLSGIVPINATIQERRDGGGHRLIFELTEEFMRETRPKRIFLSHKGADKPLVREFYSTLKLLGFDPWIDEDALPAGENLERGLLRGMQDSCAAVFFLTGKYKDAGYLAAEIDYAIAEKRKKAERFAIITLLLEPGAIVPDLLRAYVWKQPKSNLEALREIVQALPIKLPSPEWRKEIPANAIPR